MLYKLNLLPIRNTSCIQNSTKTARSLLAYNFYINLLFNNNVHTYFCIKFFRC